MSEDQKRDSQTPPQGGGAAPQPDPAAADMISEGAPVEPAGAPAATPASAGAQEPAAASAAPTQQELAIRSALETVMDPEIGLSIVDLGLVREVHLSPGRTLIRMMLTTPFCPYAPQIIAETKQAAMSVVPQECEVEIMPDAWSPDMMPDPGLLGFSY